MLPSLTHHMNINNIPYQHQYGFTKHRSTYDAIARFLRSISLQYQLPTPAIFIDISKAYDRVWVHGLIYKLQKLNIPPHLLFFYRAILSNRTFRVSANGVLSDLFSVSDGVTQGGVSTPQLFTIYIHDIITHIQSSLQHIHTHYTNSILINLFADDIALWISEQLAANTSSQTKVHLMQTALDALTTWASTWKITFSSTKTQMIIFRVTSCAHHLINTYTRHSLTLSNFIITTTDTYKYLGLMLHKNLLWTPHIRTIIDKCTPTSQQIARLAARAIDNRPSFRIIRQLITSVLIPKITYAIPFITLLKDDHKISRQLKRLIIYPLRRALGLPNNAHHNSIFIESRILPVPYLQQYHSILFARRYINQASTQAEAQQRYQQLFDVNALSFRSHPFTSIATQCKAIISPYTSTVQAIQQATPKQIWNSVFNLFYTKWHQQQHPTTINAEPHSLFPYYINTPTYTNTPIPTYLHTLTPKMSSAVSRLRFNRARLNQSLHKRKCSLTPMCNTCETTPETVEHVVMQCPRYDDIRYRCLCSLSSITKQPPLRSSFPFPYLLCEIPLSVPKNHHHVLISIIATYLSQLQRRRNM